MHCTSCYRPMSREEKRKGTICNDCLGIDDSYEYDNELWEEEKRRGL